MPERIGTDEALARLHLPEEVASVLGCSVWWVKDRARRRLIPFTRVGRAYRFSTEQLAEIIRLHEERPTRAAQRPSPALEAPARPSQLPRSPAVSAALRARPPRRDRRDRYGTAA